jgi:hypothetical protein
MVAMSVDVIASFTLDNTRLNFVNACVYSPSD